eukprot:TRINITY_DN17793_c0_g1_i1.p1 TRINITY_DN17793_c0_g1~~TRINITY_DN17793_c0_g1_i1.p1  ORF type:complete len:106 (+),score=15.97 TRINITY_DN17793_c0_g1_i1:113-430(+)
MLLTESLPVHLVIFTIQPGLSLKENSPFALMITFFVDILSTWTSSCKAHGVTGIQWDCPRCGVDPDLDLVDIDDDGSVVVEVILILSTSILTTILTLTLIRMYCI